MESFYVPTGTKIKISISPVFPRRPLGKPKVAWKKQYNTTLKYGEKLRLELLDASELSIIRLEQFEAK